MQAQFSSSVIFSSPKNTAILLVVLVSLLHLLTIGQAELTNDEAQYALYGYYLDWSYFDHPPLSGWLNALILPFSDSDFALRLWPVFLAALTSFLLYGFTRELFADESPWLGTIAVLLYQASIISQLLGLAMLPDTPLIPVAIAAVWLLYKVLNGEQSHLWIYIGILFGLAGLSKYTAVTLVITAILAIFIFNGQKQLTTRWPWIAIVFAAIVITPVVYWNMQHDWISIKYQLDHGAPDKSWLIKNALISQATQLIAYSPLVFIAGYASIFSAFKNGITSNEKFVLAFALPVLILFAWMSGNEQTLPHWTALGWIALLPLIAKWLVHNWQHTWIKTLTTVSLLYSLGISVALHIALATTLIPFDDNQHPLEDMYGWKRVAEKAVALQKDLAANSNSKTVIFVGNWSQFSRLAWYAKPATVQVTDTRYGQSDIWYGSPGKGDNGILVVPPKYKNDNASGMSKFEQCELIETVTEKINNKSAASFELFHCKGYKG